MDKCTAVDFMIVLCLYAGILGLTVLAIGNSVADWVANTVIARSDKPQMAFASCFGAPLLGHVIGLSTAIIVCIVCTTCTLILLFALQSKNHNRFLNFGTDVYTSKPPNMGTGVGTIFCPS